MKNDTDLTVYFDGACPLCSAEIKHYQSRVGADRINFQNLAEAETHTGDDLDKSAALARFHIRLADGTVLSGARAFVAVWETLPNWQWLARIAKFPGVVTILEIAYRCFLPLRPGLSWIARKCGATPTSNMTSQRAPSE